MMIINISIFCIRKLNTIKQIKHSVILGVALMNDILVFKNGELELEVALSKDRENVRLSQRQMDKLFNVDRTRITRHINNIYKDGELDEKSACAENAHMGNLGVQIYSNTICKQNTKDSCNTSFRI